MDAFGKEDTFFLKKKDLFCQKNVLEERRLLKKWSLLLPKKSSGSFVFICIKNRIDPNNRVLCKGSDE